MTRTSIIIRPLLEFLFPTASPDTIDFYHGIVRKLAHLTEYGVLAALAMRAFVTRQAVVYSILTVLFVAATDEFIQSFNPARTGTPVDVVIDLAGGSAVIAAIYLFRRRRSSRQA